MNRTTRLVIAVEVVLAAVGLVIGRWIGTPILENARVDLHDGVVAAAATLPLVVYAYWVLRTRVPFFARLRDTALEIVEPMFRGCSTIDFAVIAVMAGIGEEILFRGLLQASLGQVVDPWIAVALVGVLFGLVHAVTLGYAVVAALLGAYIGALFLVTDNLFVPIAVHALFDFVALVLFARTTAAAEPV